MKCVKAAVLSGVLLSVASFSYADAIVIEDFESGSYGASWTRTGPRDFGSVNPAAAHDGGYGVSNSGWAWYTGEAGQLAEGDSVSAWFRMNSSSGRFYLGFDSDAFGTDSFVAAKNSGDIRFQENLGYGYRELNISGQSFEIGSWYLAEVVLGAGNTATGNLYGSDGTTLLNSLSHTFTDGFDGGVAIRSFGNIDIDTIAVDKATAPVPEPSTTLLFATGIAGLAGLMRRRRK